VTPDAPTMPRLPEVDVLLEKFWRRTSNNGEHMLGVEQFVEAVSLQ